MGISARGPVGQHQQRLVAPSRGRSVLLPGDLMGEVMAALAAALRGEPRIWATGVGTGQPASVRGGADVVTDGAVGEVEQGSVGLPSPYLPEFAGTIEERTVAAVGNGGRLLKHHSAPRVSTRLRPVDILERAERVRRAQHLGAAVNALLQAHRLKLRVLAVDRGKPVGAQP